MRKSTVYCQNLKRENEVNIFIKVIGPDLDDKRLQRLHECADDMYELLSGYNIEGAVRLIDKIDGV